jgi:hypothetical protein
VKQLRGVRKYLWNGLVFLVSAGEIVLLVCVVGFFTIKEYPPKILIDQIQSQIYDNTKDVKGTGNLVTREDAMGKYADMISTLPRSRDYFVPDHSQDKNVVVISYIIGSNLENSNGLASANIEQMKDATEQGDNLTFVMEAGGSKRWFTDEIDNSSYGRYTIKGGEIKKIEDLPDDTCMSKEKTLAEFLAWTKKNYPADRYMLVLWDHGGGLAYGYGQDSLNKRPEKENKYRCISTSEIVSAIRDSGVKFDMIGFDACLMQDVEVATAMEPYADYYLASEEVEGGFGWFYTSAFGKLAKDPGLPTEEFAKELISCYDPYNTIIKDDDGKPDTKSTLSFVDLTMVKPAYEKLSSLFKDVEKAIRKDRDNYAAVAVAANSAYTFDNNLQIDLMDFLTILDKGDYENSICSHEKKVDVLESLRACVLFRNGDSAKGINGLALALPYQDISHYTSTSTQLKALSENREKKALDVIFSIIAAQKKKEHDEKEKQENLSFLETLSLAIQKDYTKEKWYIKGFEDYANADTLTDVPLKETPEGYQIMLPKKAWKTVADCQTMVYQRTKDGPKGSTMRYLGSDHIGADDPDGHPLVNMDDSWVTIDGNLVCYEAKPPRETEDGDVFSGTVRAELNESERIILHIEWDPIKDGSDAPETGHVIGYEIDTNIPLMQSKGLEKLSAGDSIQFVFDYYDDEGNLVDRKPAGDNIRVTKQNRLEVADQKLPTCDIIFGGLLKDVYQRNITTEQIEMKID